MASLKDIRSRIESTKNTQQITKAMKLVSAAKLRKAQHQVVNIRPYAHSLMKMISNIVATERVNHPFLTPKEEIKKVLLLVLSSDRGLCGGFNAQINKFTEQYYKSTVERHESIDYIFIGRRGLDYFTKRKFNILDSMTKLDKEVSYDLADSYAKRFMDFYLSGEYDEIRIIYNEFKSAISQAVVCETLFPVDVQKQSQKAIEGHEAGFSNDMIFEPLPDLIIEDLLIKHFGVQIYRCMCESVAAEHGARMTAMENATNNARDVLARLTLTYNKLRQEKITTELIEIVSGAEAL